MRQLDDARMKLGQLGEARTSSVSTQLDGVLEARTSVTVLGGYRAGWLAKDGYEPMGSSGQDMGLGNPCGLVLDITRSVLTVPGHLHLVENFLAFRNSQGRSRDAKDDQEDSPGDEVLATDQGVRGRMMFRVVLPEVRFR
ncbi:hypothetical protein F2Q69_00006771 [Brassica cretica]|uniref:Uncharacterized protein n=1 Tax=Brassica cretica TaxID=69181 RepID=A0A8S9P707_BRACR|nr:hypothetical protein F2Q69_00006771 [Brassica cretica]